VGRGVGVDYDDQASSRRRRRSIQVFAIKERLQLFKISQYHFHLLQITSGRISDLILRCQGGEDLISGIAP
jgi:hypothetical protein